MLIFEIRGKAPVSSKNGKMITRGRLIQNPKVFEYKQWAQPMLLQAKADIISQISTYPAKFHFTFYFPDKRRRDLINFALYPADLFTELGIIPDDDYLHFWPIFDAVYIDRENPGFSFYIE